jgi:hypothetical protein
MVSIKHRLQTLLLCLPLLMGAIGGMPMRPEEIEDLMRTMNQQKVVMTVEDDEDRNSLPKLPEPVP